MKKFFVLLLLCLTLFPMTNFAMAEDTSQIYVVNANSANVYLSADFSSEVVTVLHFGNKISVQTNEGRPVTYLSDGFSFVKTLGEFEGYVLADLVSPETETITSIPNYNGKINTDCKVFFMQDNVMQESEINLSKNQRIFIYKAFDSKSAYTQIAFEHDNKIVYGYVQTKYVAPDGINPLLITCIVVILALLGIIFAWIFMKKSKIKKINGTKN